MPFWISLGVPDVLRLFEAKQQNCELHARAGGSGLLWFPYQTEVSNCFNPFTFQSVRSQKHSFIDKMVQVILVYKFKWVCLTLPNGFFSRATKMIKHEVGDLGDAFFQSVAMFVKTWPPRRDGHQPPPIGDDHDPFIPFDPQVKQLQEQVRRNW